MNYPYNQGWPTNPFKQLTPHAMAALLRQMAAEQRQQMEDAPW